jgi:flagellar basal-body rod protein FlgB
MENINLFNLASKRLQWISDRQRVISENVANADVAGYRAKEVENFDAYLQRAKGANTPPPAEVHETETPWSSSLSGNTVILEDQLLEASSANGQYRVATSLYRKAHEMLAAVVTAK